MQQLSMMMMKKKKKRLDLKEKDLYEPLPLKCLKVKDREMVQRQHQRKTWGGSSSQGNFKISELRISCNYKQQWARASLIL